MYLTHKRRHQTVEGGTTDGELRVIAIVPPTSTKGNREPLLVQQTSVSMD